MVFHVYCGSLEAFERPLMIAMERGDQAGAIGLFNFQFVDGSGCFIFGQSGSICFEQTYHCASFEHGGYFIISPFTKLVFLNGEQYIRMTN